MEERSDQQEIPSHFDALLGVAGALIVMLGLLVQHVRAPGQMVLFTWGWYELAGFTAVGVLYLWRQSR